LDVEKFLEEKASLIDRAIEKYIPRKFSKEAILFKVNPPLTQSGTCWTAEANAGDQPYSY
jgi:hypothetical protein